MAEKKQTGRAARARRALLHLADGRRIPVEKEEVFFLEADRDEALVRTANPGRYRHVD